MLKKPPLLFTDETQELARNRENEPVATALRTTLTKYRDKMRVVFTGSSRMQLAHVFSLSKSPRGVYTFESAAFERWVRTLAQ